MSKEKEFYIEKIDSRGSIDIWIVDGAFIRANLEREFTNFGQHFKFSVIPENEFWLDKEADPDERKFFIDHLLVEWKLMKEGKSYDEAIEVADKKEMEERRKTRDFDKVLGKGGELLPENVHKKLIGETDGGVMVWSVLGRLVRSVFNIDFTEGGHDKVYSFVPQEEVWIDDDISEKEFNFVLLHELFERSLMEKGLVYNDAHKKASQIEWEARHNNEKLAENLSILGWKV